MEPQRDFGTYIVNFRASNNEVTDIRKCYRSKRGANPHLRNSTASGSAFRSWRLGNARLEPSNRRGNLVHPKHISPAGLSYYGVYRRGACGASWGSGRETSHDE